MADKQGSNGFEEDEDTEPQRVRNSQRATAGRPRVLTHRERVELFGHFEFRHAPVPGNPEHIEIDPAWVRDNIVRVTIPQYSSRTVRVHRIMAQPLLALFAAWEAERIDNLVITINGAWAQRYKRTSGTVEERIKLCRTLGAEHLSTHAFGGAIDLNAIWNQQGRQPAPADAQGTVLPLVPLAYAHGFAWGGDWSTRVDGMHFELAELRPRKDVA